MRGMNRKDEILRWLKAHLETRGRGAQTELAAAIGVSNTMLSRMLSGKRDISADEILRISEYFQDPLPYNFETGGTSSNVFSTPGFSEPDHQAESPLFRTNAVIGDSIRQSALRRVPVLGSVIGGSDGRFVLNGQTLKEVFAPANLVDVKDLYAVFIHGDSMVPRYYAGEIAWPNPNVPVRQNDFVVVQLRDEDDGGYPIGLVKQFISWNAKELVLRQFKRRDDIPDGTPEEEAYLIRIPSSRVINVHKIVQSGDA